MATPQSSIGSTLIPGAHQNISLRIGRSAAELAKPCFTAGTSRVARSRAAKALGLRKRKPVSPQSPPSPNQESAVNPRTGKVAFGPWLGPYETHTEALASEPLFLDHQGNTYASLSAAGLQGLPKGGQQTMPLATDATVGDKAGAAATAATRQLYALMGKVVQRQALAAQTHNKPTQWPGRGKPHGNGRCCTTMARAINQPRRS